MKLQIKELKVEIEGKQVLNNLNLEINKGEIHAIMGPNGTGKSTLSRVIMGDENYKVKSGDILFDNQSILKEKKRKENKRKENKRKEYVVDDVIGVPPDDSDGESFPSENVGDDVLKPIGGIYGKNVVYLTDRQNDDLLRRLSTDEYDRYISALADWLIHNPDARIHSHYDTILHWADEDRRVRPK